MTIQDISIILTNLQNKCNLYIIQKIHLEGRTTKTEMVKAKKRLLGVFSSENCVRIGIHKRHLEA